MKTTDLMPHSTYRPCGVKYIIHANCSGTNDDPGDYRPDMDIGGAGSMPPCFVAGLRNPAPPSGVFLLSAPLRARIPKAVNPPGPSVSRERIHRATLGIIDRSCPMRRAKPHPIRNKLD